MTLERSDRFQAKASTNMERKIRNGRRVLPAATEACAWQASSTISQGSIQIKHSSRESDFCPMQTIYMPCIEEIACDAGRCGICSFFVYTLLNCAEHTLIHGWIGTR
ncbi:hypothetical protein [Rhizobium sp. CECT 9324]|uniref:hypothetical protein n=1 Tax=Rhizobium sp. CECT 9324 TaxID=2845820 RepID=UPI001E51CF22|nr:hypothetical protein [Rhizobium sp. CECT 9324]